MKTQISIHTPLGEFGSLASAARAHACDRSTLLARCESEPDQYRKITRPKPGPAVPVIRGQRWPITWTQYRYQSEEVKDAIWQDWCRGQGLDPDLESTAEQFFAEMDAVVLDSAVEDEADLAVED
jgi:predicted GNAT family acetyltransferase